MRLLLATLAALIFMSSLSGLATAVDADGDGVDDSVDNCVGTANPKVYPGIMARAIFIEPKEIPSGHMNFAEIRAYDSGGTQITLTPTGWGLSTEAEALEGVDGDTETCTASLGPQPQMELSYDMGSIRNIAKIEFDNLNHCGSPFGGPDEMEIELTATGDLVNLPTRSAFWDVIVPGAVAEAIVTFNIGEFIQPDRDADGVGDACDSDTSRTVNIGFQGTHEGRWGPPAWTNLIKLSDKWDCLPFNAAGVIDCATVRDLDANGWVEDGVSANAQIAGGLWIPVVETDPPFAANTSSCRPDSDNDEYIATWDGTGGVSLQFGAVCYTDNTYTTALPNCNHPRGDNGPAYFKSQPAGVLTFYWSDSDSTPNHIRNIDVRRNSEAARTQQMTGRWVTLTNQFNGGLRIMDWWSTNATLTEYADNGARDTLANAFTPDGWAIAKWGGGSGTEFEQLHIERFVPVGEAVQAAEDGGFDTLYLNFPHGMTDAGITDLANAVMDAGAPGFSGSTVVWNASNEIWNFGAGFDGQHQYYVDLGATLGASTLNCDATVDDCTSGRLGDLAVGYRWNEIIDLIQPVCDTEGYTCIFPMETGLTFTNITRDYMQWPCNSGACDIDYISVAHYWDCGITAAIADAETLDQLAARCDNGDNLNQVSLWNQVGLLSAKKGIGDWPASVGMMAYEGGFSINYNGGWTSGARDKIIALRSHPSANKWMPRLIQNFHSKMNNVPISDFYYYTPLGSFANGANQCMADATFNSTLYDGIILAQLDRDKDWVNDGFDNCIGDANESQVDTNGDGIGDACDGDFDDDGDVDGVDFLTFRGCYILDHAGGDPDNCPGSSCGGPTFDPTCDQSDLDNDGDIDGPDFVAFRGWHLTAMPTPALQFTFPLLLPGEFQ